MKRIPFIVVFSLLPLVSSVVQADDEFFLDLSAGYASSSESGYDSSAMEELAVAYASSDLVYRVGYSNYDGFKLQDMPRSDIKSRGLFAQVAYTLEYRVVNLELGGGMYRMKSEARFYGTKLGSSDQNSVFASAFLVRDFSKHWSLLIGAKYLNDVAGANLTNWQIGLRARM